MTMTRPVLLGLPEHHWVCPNCTGAYVTREVQPHTPFHACRGLLGLTAPFVPDGTRCKVEKIERGDYLRSEVAHRDEDGRPFMAVVTTRDDGQDCAVLAPVATAGGGVNV